MNAAAVPERSQAHITPISCASARAGHQAPPRERAPWLNRVQISPFTAPGAARNHTAPTGRLVLAGLALDHRRSEVTGGPSAVTVMPPAVPIDDPSLRQPPMIGHRRWAMPRLGDPALSMAASHIRSCITGRVGNVRATSEKPAATNIAMVPV